MKEIIAKMMVNTSFFMLLVFLFVNCACNSHTYKSSKLITSKKEDYSSHSSNPGIQRIYSPLEYAKYTTILQNNLSFSQILIQYTHDYNWQYEILTINAELVHKNYTYSEITNYKGERSLITYGLNQNESSTSKTNFTAEEVAEIYNYLINEDNRDYFFNGCEYTGFYPPPVESCGGTLPLCKNKYNLSLIITQPDKQKEAWAIHKCVDALEPGHPMTGLVQLLEEDFISKFE
jgi:hypothetical protein